MNKVQKIAFVGLLGLSFFTTTAFAAVDDYTNRYALDEGEGRVVGDLVGGQHGQLVGTSTGFGWTSGMIGTALSMDGVAGESITFPDGFVKGSQGSLSAWIKLNTLSDRNYIFSGRSTNDNYIYATLMVDRDGRLQFQYRTTTNGNDRKAQGSRILGVNEWYLVVFTGDGQTYRMFVNGEEFQVAGDNVGRWFSDLTNQTLAYRAGALESNPFTGVFDGNIDDLRFYDRPLTSDDVKALYNGGTPGTPTVPVALRPSLVLAVSGEKIPFGGSATINWAADKVDSCTASGDWSGSLGTSGSQTFSKLSSNATYGISCSGKGGVVSRSIQVLVAEKGKEVIATPLTQGTLSVTNMMPNPTGEGSPAMTLTAGSPWKRNLSVGARGDDVRALQLFFVKKGYLVSANATGYFGPLTKAAAIKFQKETNLPQTGFVGVLTRAKLDATPQ